MVGQVEYELSVLILEGGEIEMMVILLIILGGSVSLEYFIDIVSPLNVFGVEQLLGVVLVGDQLLQVELEESIVVLPDPILVPDLEHSVQVGEVVLEVVQEGEEEVGGEADEGGPGQEVLEEGLVQGGEVVQVGQGGVSPRVFFQAGVVLLDPLQVLPFLEERHALHERLARTAHLEVLF